MDDGPGFNVLLEVFKFFLSLLLLVITWLGGQSIIAYWDYRKKRNEIDIGSAQRFFELYGEFKAVNRLWNTFCFNKHPEMSEKNKAAGKKMIEIPDEHTVRWELLKRAADAESGVESLVLKLATERSLDGAQLKALGQFRQAYQKLRESIRQNEPLGWKRGSEDYVLFNDLAATFARMISLDRAPKLEMIALDAGPDYPPPETARKNLKAITGFDSKQFGELAKEGVVATGGTAAGGDSKDG